MKLLVANYTNDAKSVANPDRFTSDQYAKTRLCSNGENPANNHFVNASVGTSLEGIFQQIGSWLVSPRLISNDAE